MSLQFESQDHAVSDTRPLFASLLIHQQPTATVSETPSSFIISFLHPSRVRWVCCTTTHTNSLFTDLRSNQEGRRDYSLWPPIQC